MMGVEQVGMERKAVTGEMPRLLEGGRREAVKADCISFPGPLSTRPDPQSLISVRAKYNNNAFPPTFQDLTGLVIK